MMSLVSSHLEAPTSLAIVAASNEPLLFLTQDLTISAVSESFCRAFQIEPAGLAGRRLSDIGAGEWGNSKLASRKVQSEEARGYLKDAHHQVMSIAAVQRHLAL